MAGDSSDDEPDAPAAPVAKPKNRFKFRTFAQRLAEVDVATSYRQLRIVATEPGDGHQSFFQEALEAWRELNTAADFNTLFQEINQQVLTFPLLLHHKEKVFGALLARLNMAAMLSLPPVLALLGTLARDLQGDFMPLLPRYVDSLAALMHEGLHHEPEMLEEAFQSLAAVCRQLAKPLAADLAHALEVTRVLRYSPVPHVRRFAAEVLGYLFRTAPIKVLEGGVSSVLEEYATEPGEERREGAGMLLAEAVTGVQHGLHSRLPTLLPLVLHAPRPEAGFHGGDEAWHERVAEVTEVTVAHLAQHLRRGKGQELWAALLKEAMERLDACPAPGAAAGAPPAPPPPKKKSKKASKKPAAPAGGEAGGGGGGGGGVAERRHVARCASLLCRLAEHRRGSIVEDFAPLFDLARRLLQPEAIHPPPEGHCPPPPPPKAGEEEEEEEEGEEGEDVAGLDGPRGVGRPAGVMREALRLMLAITRSHQRVVSASKGMVSVARALPSWTRAFQQAPAELLHPFGRGLLSLEAQHLQLLSPHLLEALSRCYLESGAPQGGGGAAGGKEMRGRVLLLVSDVLARVQPVPRAPPLLRAAGARGRALADALSPLLSAWSPPKKSKSGAPPEPRPEDGEAWAAVHLLPYASDDPEGAVAAMGALEKQARAAAKAFGRDDAPAFVFLEAEAKAAAAAMLGAEDRERLDRGIEQQLQWLVANSTSPPVVRCVARYLDAAMDGEERDSERRRRLLPATRLRELLPHLSPCFSSHSSELRVGALAVAAHFEQPSLRPAENALDGAPPQPCTALPEILAMMDGVCSVKDGRAHGNRLGRVKLLCEQGRMPPELAAPAAHALIGTLHIRFALLWEPAAGALGALCEAFPDDAWPLVMASVHELAGMVLAGEEAGMAPLAPGDEPAPPSDLAERFWQAVGVGTGRSGNEMGSTDCGNRLANTLKALAAVPEVAKKRSGDWVPLMLHFTGVAKGEGEGGEEAEENGDVIRNGKHWREGLAAWLGALSAVKGPRALHRAEAVWDLLVRFLEDPDPNMQRLVLRCLGNWKLKYLSPYYERMDKLVGNDTLRAELSRWRVSRGQAGMEDEIQSEHRPGLIPLLVRLLFPKMKKRSGRLGGRGAKGSARTAVLIFLCALDTPELLPLFQLFLQPLSPALVDPDAAEEASAGPKRGPAQMARVGEGVALPWWAHPVARNDPEFLDLVDSTKLWDMPLKNRVGFLHAAGDLVGQLGQHMASYLHPVVAFTVSLLESACADPSGAAARAVAAAAAAEEKAAAAAGSDSDEEMDEEEEEEELSSREKKMGAHKARGAREVRGLSLRLLASMFARYPSFDFAPYWPSVFAAVAPSCATLHLEAVANGLVPLLEVGVNLAKAPQLCGHLAPGEGGEGILPSAFLVLGEKAAPAPALDAAMGMVESLLGHEGEVVETVLLPHLSLLLERLQQQVLLQAAGQGRARGRGTRELAILEKLGGYVRDPDVADQLAAALLPLVKNAAARKRPDERTCGHALGVLASVWGGAALCDDPSVAAAKHELYSSHTAILAPLFSRLASQDARGAACRAVAALGALHPPTAAAGELLSSLNQMSTDRLDEPDYEGRLAAYSGLTEEAWAGLGRARGLLVAHQCFFDLRTDDIALRHSGAQALSRLIDAAASEDAAAGPAGTGPEGLPGLAYPVVYPQAKSALSHAVLAVRQEHLMVLQKLAAKLPARFGGMSALVSEDTEVDFFHNASHLQVHRRVRALQRLRNTVKAGALSLEALLGVAVPLLTPILLEPWSEKRNLDKETNLIDGAIACLGAIAGALPWLHYKQLLKRLMRMVSRHSDMQKPLVRSVCSALDAFHFDSEESVHAGNFRVDVMGPAVEDGAGGDDDEDDDDVEAGADGETEGAENKEEGGEGERGAGGEEEEEEEEGMVETGEGGVPKSVVHAMRRDILPKMYTLLRDRKHEDAIRAPIALGIVKLLKRLPDEVIQEALPKTLHTVAGKLKSRSQGVRDDARTVLVNVASELGASYLGYMVEVLTGLLTTGYMMHVLGYTLHAVLDGVARTAAVGDLDDTAADLLPLLEADIFGQVSEEKEVDAIAASSKECRRCRSYESVELLGRLCTFRTHLTTILILPRSKLSVAGLKGTRHKMDELLRHLARGLSTNPGATPTEVMMFVHSTVGEGVDAEKREAAELRAAKEQDGRALAAAGLGEKKTRERGRDVVAAMPVTGRKTVEAEAARKEIHAAQAAKNEHLIVQLALQLLLTAIKKDTVGARTPEGLALLDPLLPLLVMALASRHQGVVSLAVKSLCHLVKLPLPGLPGAAPNAGHRVVQLMRASMRASSDLCQDSFQLVAGLIRGCKVYQPPESQLRFLLGFAFGDLEDPNTRATTFSLLKAIVARRMLLPEVYDLMGRVGELVARSQAQPVRQLCSQVLLQFMLDYPLGNKRLQHHINALVANLDFEYEDGRASVLEMVNAVVAKFPQPLLEQQCELLYLPLVTRLVNDGSPKCRAMVGAVIKNLIKHVGPGRADRLFKFAEAWYGGGDPRLRRAAAQTLGLFAEAEGARFDRRVPALVPLLIESLERRPEDGDDADEDGEDGGAKAVRFEDEPLDGAAKGWQEAYYSLSLSEKMLSVGGGCASHARAGAMWAAAGELVLHRHMWVRKAAGRVLGRCFALAQQPEAGDGDGDEAGGGEPSPGAEGAMSYLSGEGRLRTLANDLCSQLEAPGVDAALGAQLTRNLVFVAAEMHDLEAAEAELAGEGEGAGVGAEEGGGDSEGEGEDGEEEEGGRSKGGPGSSLRWVVRRVARVAGGAAAGGGEPAQACAALRALAALATRMGADAMAPHAQLAVGPVYKILEDKSGRKPDPDVKELAEEVATFLKDVLGTDRYVAAYACAGAALKGRREGRKRKVAVEAMVDPERSAKRRIKKAAKRSQQRKRKVEEYRRERGQAGPAVKAARA